MTKLPIRTEENTWFFTQGSLSSSLPHLTQWHAEVTISCVGNPFSKSRIMSYFHLSPVSTWHFDLLVRLERFDKSKSDLVQMRGIIHFKLKSLVPWPTLRWSSMVHIKRKLICFYFWRYVPWSRKNWWLHNQATSSISKMWFPTCTKQFGRKQLSPKSPCKLEFEKNIFRSLGAIFDCWVCKVSFKSDPNSKKNGELSEIRLEAHLESMIDIYKYLFQSCCRISEPKRRPRSLHLFLSAYGCQSTRWRFCPWRGHANIQPQATTIDILKTYFGSQQALSHNF